MRQFILCTLVLTACGSDAHHNNAAPVAADPTEQPIDSQPAPDEHPIASVPYSMALATAADLPACDAAHDKQLVYVLDTKQFQTCQAGAWAAVEIAAPTAKLDLTTAQNLLSTIKPRVLMSDILPEVRAVLLGPNSVHTEVAADSDTCLPHLAGDKYEVTVDAWRFIVEFRGDYTDYVRSGTDPGETDGCDRTH